VHCLPVGVTGRTGEGPQCWSDVRSRVADTEGAEVDDSGEPVPVDDQVARLQITVDPYGRSAPVRSGQAGVPGRFRGGDVEAVVVPGETGQHPAHTFVSVVQGGPARTRWLAGAAGRIDSVQGTNEGGHLAGQRDVVAAEPGRGAPLEPWHHGPPPRKSGPGSPT
jgi:hypothetical protein